MNNRLYYLLHSFAALAIGLADYVFFRKGTYLNRIFISLSKYNLSNKDFFGIEVLKFYLTDFLWGYAFSMALYAVLYPKIKNRHGVFFLVSFLGIMWEFLQKLSIVSGTFDIIDCLLYILAAFVADFIFTKGRL